MSPSHDPIERLAAADPLRDGELLTESEQREADMLLARILAEEPKRAPRRRHHTRRWLVAVAATACGLALAVTAIDVLDEGGPGPSVVDRAVAAVSDANAIYHTIEVAKFGEQHAYREAWYGSRVTHQKTYNYRDGRRGKLIIEEVTRPRRTRQGREGGLATVFDAEHNLIQRIRQGRSLNSPFPTIDQRKDPGAGLRELQRQGRLRLAGSQRFEGRRVYRLVGVVHFPEGRVDRLIYLVDAHTYYPVFLRWVYTVHGSTRAGFESRFSTYERLPVTAESRALLRMDPHPGARPDRNRDGVADSSGGRGGR
jgi:hypothetical protein